MGIPKHRVWTLTRIQTRTCPTEGNMGVYVLAVLSFFDWRTEAGGNFPAELLASSDGHSGNHCSALSFS